MTKAVYAVGLRLPGVILVHGCSTSLLWKIYVLHIVIQSTGPHGICFH